MDNYSRILHVLYCRMRDISGGDSVSVTHWMNTSSSRHIYELRWAIFGISNTLIIIETKKKRLQEEKERIECLINYIR